MRIITTRKFRFYSKDRKENFVTKGGNLIEEAPEYIKEDRGFNLARQSGQLQVLVTSQQTRLAESDSNDMAQTSHEAKEHFENSESIDEEVTESVDEKKAKRAARKAAKRAAKEAAEEEAE